MTQIIIDGDEMQESFPLHTVHIKNIRSIFGIDSLAENFRKEIKNIQLEDLLLADQSIENIIEMIRMQRPNMIVLQNKIAGQKMFLAVETEVQVGDYAVIRGRRMLYSGTYEQMQIGAMMQIKREFPGKFDRLKPEELDGTWLKHFSKLYFNDENKIRIVNLKP